MDTSRNFTFWKMSEFFLHFCLFLNFYLLGNSRTFMFWVVPNILSYLPFPNFYILDHSICFSFLNSRLVQECFILDNSIFFKFLTIPELLPPGPSQNVCILDLHRMLSFWTISDFFFLSRTVSRIFILCTIQKFSTSGPFMNFYILDAFTFFFIFQTNPENSCSGMLQNCPVIQH